MGKFGIATYKKRIKKVVPYQTYRTLYAPQLSYGCLKWEGGGKRKRKQTNKQTETNDSLVKKTMHINSVK